MTLTLPLQPTADDVAHLETDLNRKCCPHLLDPNNEIRQRIIIERAVIRRACTDLIAAGKHLRVFYGHENGDSSDYGCLHTKHLPNVMEAIGACDEEWINVYDERPVAYPGTGMGLKFIGQIALVHGNDGWDVIADYHTCLEDFLKGANEFADQIADAS